MRRAGNTGTIRITEWVPTEGKCSQGWQKTRWGGEFRKFAGAIWDQLAQDWGFKTGLLEEAFVLR